MAVRVTFVMPAYNACDFIAQAIESLQRQTVAEWKLIVVDDGSTDGTLEIVRSFARNDARISVMSMPEASGSAFMPRKVAVESADTEYVSPLDADDCVAVDYLEKLLDAVSATGADIVYPTMWRASGADYKDVRRFAPVEDSLYGCVRRGRDLIKYTLDGWRMGANGGLIRRDLYVGTLSEYDVDRRIIFSDELFTRYLLLNAAKTVISSARYYYRDNSRSVTSERSERAFGYLSNNRVLIEFCRKEFSEKSEEYILAQRQNFHGVFDALAQLRRMGLKGAARADVMRNIRESAKAIDREIVRYNTSRRYQALLHLPFAAITAVLSIYEHIKRRKQL